MPIKIFNSLSKKKEELTPLNGKTIKMYSCGVTVYDQCHIGHARSLYIFDVICNYLKYRGYDVHFVRNITDIDDKIINKANELKKDWSDIVKQNIELYKKDLKDLNISEANQEPRATNNIDIVIKHIQGLIDKEYAYEANGDVYFSVRSFKDYGKLSGQSIEQMLEGVRVDSGEHKRDPLDFALWKKSKEGEPHWSSPWGEGRPGWHIECSCMSMKHLGTDTLDIHAGGRDLIFPHHENEIAQSEALTGKQFAKQWIHHGLLTINGQKMAKSLGNFVTIQDAVRKYDVSDLKMFFLSSHYASPVDFSDKKMTDAHKAHKRLEIPLFRAHKIISDKRYPNANVHAQKEDFIIKHEKNFISAMDDDFNTPKALAVIFDFVSDLNKYIDSHQSDSNYVTVIYQATEETLWKWLKDIFGIDAYWEVPTAEEKKLLDERIEARTKGDFKRSDEIRGLLKGKGILVEDTKDGQVWRRA